MSARRIPPRDPKAPHALWTFYQEGWDVPVTGHSRANLLDNILRFRLDNGLDVGQPEEELENQLRYRHPGFYPQTREVNITDEALDKKARSALDEVRLTNKLWTKFDTDQAKAGKRAQRVRRDEAEARAEVCAACPANTKVSGITSCSPCVANLNREALILSSNQRTKQTNLAFCASLLHDNRVAVWMPKEALGRSLSKINAETPALCWLRECIQSH